MSTSPKEPLPESNRLIVGDLISRGRGTYDGAPSYFVRIQTARGPLEIWGADLERAFRKSSTQPQLGEPIGLRENGTDPLVAQTYRRLADGSRVLEDRVERARPHWRVERREYWDERQAAADLLRDPRVPAYKAVLDHPHLEGAYSVLVRAIAISQRHYKSPKDRLLAVGLVREALARTAEIGEPLPPKLNPDPVLIEALEKSRKRDAQTR